jgi:DNA polymerase elongation subunit (family B)
MSESPYPPEDSEFPLEPEEELILKPFHMEEHDNFENSGQLCLHMYCHDRKSNTIKIGINNFRVYCCLELPTHSLEKIPDPSGDFRKDKFEPKSFISWDQELADKIFLTLANKQANNISYKTKNLMEPPFDRYFNFFTDIYYYTGKKKPYLYLYFHTLQARNDMMNTINYPIFIKGEGFMKFVMHENKITTFRRLFSKQNVKYTQWISIKGRHVPFENKNRVCKSSIRDYIVDYKTMVQIDEKLTSTWFVYPKLFSWDGEMYAKNHKRFPAHKQPHDVVYLISVVFQYMEHPETQKRVCLVFGQCEDIPGVEVIRFNSEKDLLVAFCHMFNYFDPDLILGYNTSGFDYPYIIGRFERNQISIENIPSTGRLLRAKTQIYEMNWASSGGGKNSITLIKHFGRDDIDMLPNLRRLYKLRQYTLNFVSNKFLNEEKHDIKAKQMFEIYEDSIGENKGLFTKDFDGKEKILTMTDVAAYCVQDSVLPIKLFDNRKIWYHLSSLSSAAGVSQQELFTRGEQIRCYSNIADKCFKQGKVLSNPQYFDYYFKGGFVGKPKPGVYKYVFTLDFASLYPSIMRAYNISIDSIIRVSDWVKFDPNDVEINYFEQDEPADYISSSYRADLEDKYKILLTYHKWLLEYQRFKTGEQTSLQTEQEYFNILMRHRVDFTEDDFTTMNEMGLKGSKKMAFNPDNPEEYINYDPDYLEDINEVKASGGIASFDAKISVKRRYEIRIIKKSIYEGIMSLLETEWFSKRKDIKKLMKACENKLKERYDKTIDAERDVHNAGQNAVKLMMNSGYGFNGVSKGMLPALLVAILTTALGRRLIGMVNDILTEEYKEYGAKVVYNDTDSSMVALDIKDEDVMSGKINLKKLMDHMEDTTNGRKEKEIYNNDATIKEIHYEDKSVKNIIYNLDATVRKIEYKNETVSETGDTSVNEIIYNSDTSIKKVIYNDPTIKKVFYNPNATINKIIYNNEVISEIGDISVKEIIYNKNASIKQVSYNDDTTVKEIIYNDDATIEKIIYNNSNIKKIIYNDDATVNYIIPSIPTRFREELTMECENCCVMCPLKPKYYIKLHREVDLAKILKNGPYKKDKDGNYEITSKGILTSKKGNAEFANIIYDTLVNQVIFIKHPVEMLTSLSKHICDFLSDKFNVKDLCRVTELGQDYKQEGYFMNVFANYLTSKGMQVKAGDRLEYIVVRTKQEIETGVDQNMGHKCREYSMWEASGSDREGIDYAYYIEKGLQTQFDFLFGVGNLNLVDDPRLSDVGYKPQFSWNRQGQLLIGKSTKYFIHFKNPIKMISAIVKDYMSLSIEEFVFVYNRMGYYYDINIPKNHHIAGIINNIIDRICKYLLTMYPMKSI